MGIKRLQYLRQVDNNQSLTRLQETKGTLKFNVKILKLIILVVHIKLNRGIGFTVGVGVKLTVGVAVSVGVTVGCSVGVGVGVSVGVPVGVGVSVGVGVGVSDGVGVGVSVGVLVGVSVGVGVGVSVGVGVGVSVGAVSMEEPLFCGWETVLNIKSEELFSVSSPFPKNSSEPPIPMDTSVDVLNAFLSTLDPFPGAGTIAEPSPIGCTGAPIVTASTIAPVSAGPFLRIILLSFVIVAEPFLSHVTVAVRRALHQMKNPCAGMELVALKETIEESVAPVPVLFTRR